jgi:hypothetical protein
MGRVQLDQPVLALTGTSRRHRRRLHHEQAWDRFTLAGLDTVAAEEWASPYFAPTGRSKRWKLQKRALTDAYRTRFGEPSRQEIHVLRRQRGDIVLLP